MTKFEVYSERLRKEKEDSPDVFEYNTIPEALRWKILYWVNDVVPSIAHKNYYKYYAEIHSQLVRLYGVGWLGNSWHADVREQVENFLLTEYYAPKILDVIETALAVAKEMGYFNFPFSREDRYHDLDLATQALNDDFRKASVGYQIEIGIFLRIDNELLHDQVIKPVLKLLRHEMYTGANNEFLTAHEHYRHGRNKESIVEGTKALESLLKIIFESKSWEIPKSPTLKKLITGAFENGLIPKNMESEYNGLRAMLETLGTPRNVNAAHGQGSELQSAPEYLVGFVLNSVANSMLLFAELAALSGP